MASPDRTPATAISLDPAEDTRRFYYRVKGYGQTYSILHSAVSLVPCFASMVEENPDSNTTPETALEIPTILVQNPENKHDPSYLINTPELIGVIDRYITYWSGRPAENYVKIETVESGEPRHILQEPDIQLIESYLDSRIQQTTDGCRVRMNQSIMFKKFYTISMISPLLENVDAYFQMEGFSRKLYVYCACILWNCSMMEVSQATDSTEYIEYFRQLQQDSIDEWKRQHAMKDYLIGPPTMVGSAGGRQ